MNASAKRVYYLGAHVSMAGSISVVLQKIAHAFPIALATTFLSQLLTARALKQSANRVRQLSADSDLITAT